MPVEGPPPGHTLYSSPSDLPPPLRASSGASWSIGFAPSPRGVPASMSSGPRPLRRLSRSLSLSLRWRLAFLSSELSSPSSACLRRHLHKP